MAHISSLVIWGRFPDHAFVGAATAGSGGIGGCFALVASVTGESQPFGCGIGRLGVSPRKASKTFRLSAACSGGILIVGSGVISLLLFFWT